MGRTYRLAVVATAAGLFSGLFGVGGGTVMVPLLVLWLGFGAREASAVSLAAIVAISAMGAGLQALLGNVDVRHGLLVGIPALLGVLVGTALQQRIDARWISLAFAVVLVVGALELLL